MCNTQVGANILEGIQIADLQNKEKAEVSKIYVKWGSYFKKNFMIIINVWNTAFFLLILKSVKIK